MADRNNLTNLVARLRNPELSDTFKDKNWETMAEAADEIERLREPLRYYADPARYKRNYRGDGSCDVEKDGGDRANKALKRSADEPPCVPQKEGAPNSPQNPTR